MKPAPVNAPPSLRPILILGPTAGGKTDLSVGLAEQLNGEVIGADSMQIYKHMDAGTAKPPRKLREQVPHHLFDVVEPTKRFTVHDWLAQARAAVTDIQSRGKRPILVGGTNLYIKAFIDGLMNGPGQDPAYRQTLDALPEAELHATLRKIDPKAAERIHINDRKRLTRALEVFHVSGKPISDWQTQWADGSGVLGLGSGDEDRKLADSLKPQTPNPKPHLVGLRWPVELINPRINLRVKAMFYPDKVEPQLAADVCINGEDLLAETRRLEEAGMLGEQAREALGYKQVLKYLHDSQNPLPEGGWDEETAFEKTKVLTRRFAKQQRTWLKRFQDVHWIDMPTEDPTQAAITAMHGVLDKQA